MSENNKYVLDDNYGRKIVRFRDLKIGDYFIFHGFDNVRLKIVEDRYFNIVDECSYLVSDKRNYINMGELFDIDDEVYPLRADIKLDYIYEGEE